MKKYLGISAIALGMVVASLPVMPAAAQSANAATISKDFGCGGFVPTATGGFGSFLVSFEGTQSVSNSAGVTTLICRFNIPAGQEPATATRASGFGCGTFLGFTTDSKMVATPGGEATLTCKINPSA